jgi:WD40 repeat protein
MTLADVSRVGQPVYAVRFSQNGHYLAAMTNEDVIIFDHDLKSKVATYRTGVKFALENLAVSPDGKFIAVANKQEPVKVWDARRRKELSILEQSRELAGGTCYDLQFSPDGVTLAIADGEKAILHHLKEGNEVTPLDDSTPHPMHSLCYSRDGKLLAVGDGWGSVSIYDFESETWRAPIETKSGGINDLAFSPNGGRLAIAGDGQVLVWDTLRNEPLHRLLYPSRRPVLALAVSYDGRTIATVARDATVKLWSLADGRELCSLTLPDEEACLYGVAFSPVGQTLVACGQSSRGGRLYIWQTSD